MAGDAEDEEIERAAADWLSRLNSHSVSTETIEQFYAWRRNPAHAAAFGRLEYLWDRSAALDGDRDIAHAVREVLGRPPAKARSSWLTSRRAVLAGAAGLLGAGGLGWAFQPDRYETAHGEQRTVTLDDGSKVAINTDSAIEVRISRSARRLTLVRGEAWFDVAHDPARPFTVEAADTLVTATGTSFSVRRGDRFERVVLSEGGVTVAIDDIGAVHRLQPGTALTVRAGIAGPVMPVDLASEMSWRSGRLNFKDMPLAQAIAEVNRYTRQPLRLAGSRFAAVPVNGTFETGDTDTFVAAVTALFPLAAQPTRDGILLAER
ncbi:DUF4880 domain-containing protein [Sphingomonas histidinilytica]|uniref:FecR family protein n=1 Tax=Rhizorhabdus histidinilytica TaxID=439228 RepID=A0A1T5G2V8_9SPHN|nr:FecR domain-containing protein [Rhizorhabdus histidinilytica]MBO9378356.1 DUF4880 domain-containing protein [Rhizorhabdus histidinilytica]SKC02763.1 FecR family protein [Rhizorhabdus histidinilytica]